MAFHVEISAGFHRARLFNLSHEELARQVVRPWGAGRTIAAGDREWRPRDSSLKILEGPPMETADLAFGQGWANAERACENVTRSVLDHAPAEPAPRAFVLRAAEPAALAAAIAWEHGGRTLPWPEAEAALQRGDPAVAAVILVLGDSAPADQAT